MKTVNFLLCLACSVLFTAHAAVGQTANPRNVITLNDGWGIKSITQTKKDAPLTPVAIPHTWNTEYIEGTTNYNREMMVYKRKLDITPQMKDKRLFLYFEGVNSVADVFVNRRTVGRHQGGYTAFSIEITDCVNQGANDLEVWVSNAYRTDVLPISGDFNVYGGIHRPCHLIVTEKNCITPLFYASPGVFVHQNKVSKEAADITVECKLSLNGAKQGLTLKTTVLDAHGKVVETAESAVNGEAVAQPFSIKKPNLWNGKKNPYLYTVVAELYDNGKLADRVEQKTGFRFFSVDHEKGFFLNGEYLDLYGFCRHEDVEGKGSALSREDYENDMRFINEIGATSMRLTHYPHAEPMYELCDRDGIVLWTEIPLVGPGGYGYTGYLNNPGLHDNARQYAKELVYQKYNHPSICFWGVFNEVLVNDGSKFEEYDNPIPFMEEINALYKKLDPSRLTTFATCVDQTKYLGCADLVAWNKYFGWYSDAAPAAGKFFDEMKNTSGGKPVGVSEYGAGASVKHHQWPLDTENKPDGRFHPEEAQAYCHEGNWEAFSERPYLWGKYIWVFADFHSAIRREGDRDGINDKGLLTYDRKTKKDAFYFYKANWNPEPMVYISARRYTERTEPQTQIKVYSNLGEATLYVNGKKIGTAKKDRLNRMTWDNVTLSQGKNEITVKGKSGKEQIEDSCVWDLK